MTMPHDIIEFYIGLDLGQAQDFTALAVIEKVVGEVDFDNWGHPVDRWIDDDLIEYRARHLERFALGTPYPKIVDAVVKRVAALPREGRNSAGDRPQKILVVDATGVGRPVVDLLNQQNAADKLVAVTIHGGNNVTQDNDRYNVPKRDLIGALQVLMGQERLKVAEGLPEARTLISELRDYRYKLTNTAHDTYNAREGAHDDLVLAVGVAVWAARRGFNPRIDPAVMQMLEEWL